MEWNCTLTENRLSDYLDGTLSREEAAAFSAHAATCADCTELAATVGGLVTRRQKPGAVAEPQTLVRRIVNATSGPRKESVSWRNWFAWAPALLRPRFLMGLGTVAATILILLYTTAGSPVHWKHADLSPSPVVRTANRQAHLTFAKSAKFVNDLRVVYEIQTRLQPESEPSAAPQQDQNQAPTKPQEKSQTSPNPGHSQARSGIMLASLVGSIPSQTFLR